MSCQISFRTNLAADVQAAGARCAVLVTRYQRAPELCDGSGLYSTDQGAAEATSPSVDTEAKLQSIDLSCK